MKWLREPPGFAPSSEEEMKTYNAGVDAVCRIRCMPHQSVQQLNETANGDECGACIAEVKESTISSVISIIGGVVEGMPTSRVNFLQRLRELITAEAERDTARTERDEAQAQVVYWKQESDDAFKRERGLAAELAAAQARIKELDDERETDLIGRLGNQVADALDQCTRLHERHAAVLELVRKKAEEYRETANRYAAHAKSEKLEIAKEMDNQSASDCYAKSNAMTVLAGEIESL